MSDLIERQAAVDAVESITATMSICVNEDECHGMKRMQRQAVLEITNLPSAQPEIIRCKDCKNWMPYDWMFSEVWRSQNIDDYSEDEFGCTYCDMNMGANDYCSRADRK